MINVPLKAAREKYVCYYCNRNIIKGEKYYYVSPQIHICSEHKLEVTSSKFTLMANKLGFYYDKDYEMSLSGVVKILNYLEAIKEIAEDNDGNTQFMNLGKVDYGVYSTRVDVITNMIYEVNDLVADLKNDSTKSPEYIDGQLNRIMSELQSLLENGDFY